MTEGAPLGTQERAFHSPEGILSCGHMRSHTHTLLLLRSPDMREIDGNRAVAVGVGMKSVSDAENAPPPSRLGKRQRQGTLREGQKNTQVEKRGRGVRGETGPGQGTSKLQHPFVFSLLG